MKEMMIKFDFAPINTGFAKNGIYDTRILNFHSVRSGKNIETAYVGNVSVNVKRTTNSSTAFFNKQNNLFLKKLATVISDNGSLPGIQIASRLSAISANKHWESDPYVHTAEAIKEITDLSDEDLDEEIQSIKKGIYFAVEAGFSVIQIHAAHGYLLSRLVNRKINQRSGKYAFGCLNWLKQLATFTKNLSSDVIFDVRLNILDGIEKDTTEIAYKKNIIKWCIEQGCQKVSLTNGFYDINKHLIYPCDEKFAHANLIRAIAIAEEHPEISFSIAGNMLSALSKGSRLPNNLIIALGRALIADPNAISNFKAGKASQCSFCGECHYYSLGKASLTCPVSGI